MFSKGEYVVYKHDVSQIVDIRKNHLNNNDYYILVPVNDDSLKIDVPVENRLNNIRPLISKKEAHDLIKKIPLILPINTDSKLMENEYKKLLNDGSLENLITIIKTTYLRNKERVDSNRKTGDKDNYYFKLAEEYLYNELALVLDKTYEETKSYVINEVKKNSVHDE